MLVDQQRVVVVIEDKLAERGDEATIIDSSGGTAMLDETSSPPTTTGGTWAMGQETLVHATVGDDGAYCLATVSLESGQGDAPWCAEPRHGFRGAVISDAGLSVMSFDDQRPVSCATLLAIDGADATPFEGVTDCQGWDALRLGDGTVWSEVPKPKRQDDAVFHARSADRRYDLGPGTTGTLTCCARRGVLRPRPADRRRPRATDPGHARRRVRGRLRVDQRRQRLPLRAALRRRRDHADQLRGPGRRAGDRRPTPDRRVSDFAGFPVAALDFYDDLEVDNTKSYWEKHKATYDADVKAPMIALVAALAPEFALDRQSYKVFRPYRDVRFAKDKTPYKTNQGAYVAVAPATGWYVEISARGVRTGGGCYDMGGPRLAAYRDAVADDKTGAQLTRITNKLTKAGFELGGESSRPRRAGTTPSTAASTCCATSRCTRGSPTASRR